MELARQFLEARALLRWTQDHLGEAAHIHRSEIVNVELDIPTGRTDAVEVLTSALERAGVRFGADGPELDRDAPAARARTGHQPFRWIEASDLNDWANRRAGQEGLPELLSRLLRAEHGPYLSLRFPSGDSVSQAGWDGRSMILAGHGVAPEGQAGWEIGADKRSIKSKADEDYAKRVASPEELTPAETTFVFVTPRRWARGKVAWLKEKRAEKVWKDVQALDADDLVHWIECYPAVGAWLATRLGKRPPGVSELADVWDQWAGATQTPFSTELTRLDRDEQVIDLLTWLDSPPSPHVVQADSIEEALGFAFAAVDALPEHERRAVEARTLVVDQAAAVQLSESLTPLILVLREGGYDLASQLARKGHHIYLALGPDSHAPGSTIRLAPPRRYHLQQALINMGLDRQVADTLSHDAGRSPTTLRRLMPPAPGRRPLWAHDAPSRAVITALLVGGWDEARAGDRRVLEAISGMTYDDVVRGLSPYITPFDSPFRRSETAWKLKSPRDAWGLFAAHVTAGDIDAFIAQFREVCAEIDPVYHLPADERWMAAVKEVQAEHSGLIRHAMSDTLAILAAFGDQARLASGVPERAAQAIASALSGISREAWWSLAPLLRKFAEASPTAFLNALEAALSENPSPLSVLFEGETSNGTGFARITEASWALDAMAWSPKYLLQVCRVLARLDALDPGGKNSARPIGSLRDIFLSWAPQTNAPWAQRLATLDYLRRNYNAVAWRVMLCMTPKQHSILINSAYPRWLPEAEGPTETLTDTIVYETVVAVGDRLVEDVGADVGRWSSLIDELRWLLPETRLKAGAALLAHESKISDPADRDQLRGELRKLLDTHTQYAGADWAIPLAELADFRTAFERLEPEDVVWRHAWLFSNGKGGIGRHDLDWLAARDEQQRLQDEALIEIIDQRGREGLDVLLTICSRPGDVGGALSRINPALPFRDEIIRDGLLADEGPLWDATSWLIGSTFQADARQGVTDWISRISLSDQDHRARRRLLMMLPGDRETWSFVNSLGEDITRIYWQNVQYWNLSGDRADLEFALDQLLSAGRMSAAVRLIIKHSDANLDPLRIIDTLKRAAMTPDPEDEQEASRSGMRWLHSLPEIFAHLDDREDVSDNDVATLEWIYFEALRHSTRPARTIGRQLAASSDHFMALLKIVFASDGTGDAVEPEVPEEEFERLRPLVRRGYSVLEEWWWIPGANADGEIDGAALIDWIDAVREASRACGRLAPADRRIGKVLSKARMSKDQPWPPEAVCRALEHVATNELADSFINGTKNRRGVTTRMPSDGGRLERGEAQTYRAHASHWGSSFPYAASLLARVAESYDRHGKREDESAEQYGWA